MKKILLLAVAAAAVTPAFAQTNLWSDATPALDHAYYAPAWSQLETPAYTLTNAEFKVTFPDATTDRWQNQWFITTGLNLEAGNTYRFECDITSNNAFGMYFKLTQTGNDSDPNFLLGEENVALAAGETKHIKLNFDGKNITNLLFLCDFGGNPANTEISISNFSLLLNPAAEVEPEYVKTEIWNGTGLSVIEDKIYYAPNWAQIAAPAYTCADGTFEATFPEATFGRWQNQWFLASGVAVEGGVLYEFDMDVTTDNPFNMGVKLSQVGNDALALNFAENYALAAGENHYSVRFNGQAVDNMLVLLDFGGNPANTTVKVSNLKLYTLKEKGLSVEGVEFDENAPVEYYNLQGVRVAQPESGIYIRLQGKKAVKVAL